MAHYTHDDARQRIADTPELWPYEDLLLYDWDEPEHNAWVCAAPVAELVEWARGIEAEITDTLRSSASS